MPLSRKLATLIITGKTSVSSVVELLTKYKMLPLLFSVEQAVKQMASQVKSNDTLTIETPFELSDTSVQKIKRIVGNDIAPHEVIINKNILAGFKARFRGKLYDGSAERIIRQLTNG